MKKLSSTISLLEKLGLEVEAHNLSQIQNLYKTALVDTSYDKEYEVISMLEKLVGHFDGKELGEVCEGLVFPSYGLETPDKRIVYNGESLDGFTKDEILGKGVSNYLGNFTEKYMKARMTTFTSSEQARYMRVIDSLQDLKREADQVLSIAKNQKPFNVKELKERAISQNQVEQAHSSLVRAHGTLIKFNSQMLGESGYIDLLANESGFKREDEEFIRTHSPKKKLTPRPDKDEQVIRRKKKKTKKKKKNLEDEDAIENPIVDLFSSLKGFVRTAGPSDDFNKDFGDEELSTLKRLSTLRYDSEKVRAKIDAKFAKKLGISVEKFRDITGIDNLLNDLDERSEQAVQLVTRFRENKASSILRKLTSAYDLFEDEETPEDEKGLSLEELKEKHKREWTPEEYYEAYEAEEEAERLKKEQEEQEAIDLGMRESQSPKSKYDREPSYQVSEVARDEYIRQVGVNILRGKYSTSVKNRGNHFDKLLPATLVEKSWERLCREATNRYSDFVNAVYRKFLGKLRLQNRSKEQVEKDRLKFEDDQKIELKLQLDYADAGMRDGIAKAMKAIRELRRT